MAYHLRRQIRDRIAATTVSGLSTTSTRVFQSPIFPLQTETIPGLIVSAMEADSSAGTLGPAREIQRIMNLSIEGYVALSATVLDTLDLIAKEVEEAMAGDRTINGLATESTLNSTEIRMEPELHIPVGIIRLNYSVEYRNLETAADAAA